MLADYQPMVDAYVRDDTGKVTTAQRDDAIGRAVQRYSQDRPSELVEDVNASSSTVVPLPASWITDTSGLKTLEYPIGQNPPSFLEIGAYRIYHAPGSVQTIRLREGITSGAAVRVTFTVPHTLSASVDTIPVKDRDPIARYAASMLLEELAALFAGDSDSTIQADVVDHGSKSRDYAARGRALRKDYFDLLGIDPKRAVPSGVVVDLDRPDSQGRDRIYHGRLHR